MAWKNCNYKSNETRPQFIQILSFLQAAGFWNLRLTSKINSPIVQKKNNHHEKLKLIYVHGSSSLTTMLNTQESLDVLARKGPQHCSCSPLQNWMGADTVGQMNSKTARDNQHLVYLFPPFFADFRGIRSSDLEMGFPRHSAWLLA
jgi:hypothetical protein